MSKSCIGLLRQLVECSINSLCYKEKQDVKACLKAEECRKFREAYIVCKRARVDLEGTHWANAIRRGTGLRLPKQTPRRHIETEIIARSKRQSTRGGPRKQNRAPRPKAIAVAEIKEEAFEILSGGGLEVESQDDVDFNFLQSDESESEDDLPETVTDSAEVTTSFEEISESFSFELDKFQTVAIKELLTGKSVVVCAPTGAGKTAIADGAAMACLSKGKKVIYTTPLKALSNQKLREFRERFGADRTGLVTGDFSFQFDAPVLVMTTEILRNRFYDVTSTSGGQESLDDIGLVVLDEVHYLGDPGRGSVWEELIVGCPKHIQMLCMSATVANPQDLGDWISQIHGPCTTIKTTKRPVPLSWFFSFSLPKSNQTELCELLNQERTGVNPVCIYEDQNGFEEKAAASVKPGKRVPSLPSLILLMKERGFLPAIFFIFSRADCDKQTEKMSELGICLTNETEKAAIQAAVEEVRADQPESIKESCVDALIGGVATHHAGCLPAWKLLVESLFQGGYLKVIFATETLAAGINMPARTTVISALSKKIDGKATLLQHNALLQMAGRAGRRGYDTFGNCVILQSRFKGADAAVAILRKGAEPLRSQFTTGYSLVLNLLAKFTLPEAKAFLEKSFRNYMTGVGLVRRAEQIEELKKQAKQLRWEAKQATRNSADEAEDNEQQQARDDMKAAERELRAVLKRAIEERRQLAEEELQKQSYPFPVLIDTTKNALGNQVLPAVALAERMEPDKGGSTGQKFYYCLGADNVFYKLTSRGIVGSISERQSPLTGIKQTMKAALSPKQTWKSCPAQDVEMSVGNNASAKTAYKIPPKNRYETLSWSSATELIIDAKTARYQDLRREWRKSDGTSRETSNASKGLKRNLRIAERRLGAALRLRTELKSQKDQGWKGFTTTMKILTEVGAIDKDTLELLPLGHVTRELFGDNELWMAMVFTHPSVQELTPSLLSALASTFVAPTICTKPSISIQIEPPKEIEQLLIELDAPKERLFELEVASSSVNAQSLLGLEMDPRASGLVEAWAAGCLWEEIMTSTNMDGGDVARLLMRTQDILRQIYLSHYLLEPLKAAAREAHRAINRKPIRLDVS